MSRRVAAVVAALAVLLAALLVLVFLRSRSSAPPVTAATAVTQTAAAPTEAATPVTTPTAATATSRPQATPTPTPKPTGQTILSFSIPQTVKCGATDPMNVHLSWTTVNATGVSISIDGPGKYADYPATGSADVPFACSVAQHTYLLTTEGSGTPATRMVVVKRA